MNDKLTTKEKWETVWDNVQLPVICKPVYDITHKLKTYLPQNPDCSLIEIGCAPGRWMAYFNKNFGYKVAGVEYAENAAEMTKRNMEMQAIKADVLIHDFLTFDCSRNSYDIVFSGGFIEHFRDVQPVVEKICNLSRKYVVTLIPNCLGLNGFISKAIRPEVYAQHNPINVSTLELLHKNCGIKTLFCNYVGGVRLIMPGKGNVFFDKYKFCANAVNAPVRAFNRLSMEISSRLNFVPRSRLFSESLMYIGLKENN